MAEAESANTERMPVQTNASANECQCKRMPVQTNANTLGTRNRSGFSQSPGTCLAGWQIALHKEAADRSWAPRWGSDQPGTLLG
jgi:hypothetical protein